MIMLLQFSISSFQIPIFQIFLISLECLWIYVNCHNWQYFLCMLKKCMCTINNLLCDLSFLQKTYLRKILELLSGTSNLHLNSTSKHFQESHYACQIQCTKYHDATMVFFVHPRKLHINYSLCIWNTQLELV